MLWVIKVHSITYGSLVTHLQFLDYIEPLDAKYASSVYERACTTHCPNSTVLSARYTMYAAKTGMCYCHVYRWLGVTEFTL